MADTDKEIKEFLELIRASIEENQKLLSTLEDTSDNNDRSRGRARDKPCDSSRDSSGDSSSRGSRSRGSRAESLGREEISIRLHDANEKLEMLQDSCKTHQAKLERALKKSQPARSTSASTTNKEKPRLTDEEQDIAYELKAQMMRSTLVQNAKLKNELGIVEKVTAIREAYRNNAKNESTLSRTNLIKLMRKYEKENKEGKSKLHDLEEELKQTRKERDRYKNAYSSQKRDNSKPKSDDQKTDKNEQKGEKQEDEYSVDSDHESEHKSEKSDQKSEKSDKNKKDDKKEDKRPRTAGNLRREDFLRRFEHVHEENDLLQQQNSKLRFENGQLSRDLRDSRQGRDMMQHRLATSEAARAELMKRVDRLQKENHFLNRCMNRQASDWVNLRRGEQKQQEEQRWYKIHHMSPADGGKRYRSHKVKKSADTPRTMYPPEEYASQA